MTPPIKCDPGYQPLHYTLVSDRWECKEVSSEKRTSVDGVGKTLGSIGTTARSIRGGLKTIQGFTLATDPENSDYLLGDKTIADLSSNNPETVKAALTRLRENAQEIARRLNGPSRSSDRTAVGMRNASRCGNLIQQANNLSESARRLLENETDSANLGLFLAWRSAPQPATTGAAQAQEAPPEKGVVR